MNIEIIDMENEDFLNKLKDQFPQIEEEGLLLADGLEEAFMGLGWQFSKLVAVYDIEKVLMKFERDGMTAEQAIEYFEYNVQGAYVGEETPIFLRKFIRETKH